MVDPKTATSHIFRKMVLYILNKINKQLTLDGSINICCATTICEFQYQNKCFWGEGTQGIQEI